MCSFWRVLPAISITIVLAGCSSGPWHRNYISSVPDGINLEPVDEPQIRLVTWERFEQAFAAIEQYANENNRAPEDFAPEDIRTVNAIIFAKLRLKDPPDALAIIGHTSFTYTAQLDPRAGQLQSLAADRGAHYAIATTQYLGSRKTIESLPISSTTYTTVTHRVENDDGQVEQHTDTASSHTTTWVPRTVVRNYWAHRAVLIRRINEAERRSLGLNAR